MGRDHREKPSRCTRRRFLAASVASGFGVPLFVSRSALSSAGKPGANDRIAVGAIGVGHRAQLLLQQLPDSAQVVALADCQLTSAESYNKKCGGAWPVYQDYRRLLDRKDIDAVIVATGEFQRILPSIHACQAGKDIYAEKPLSLYVREGRALVNAARRYNRVVQVGTQQRSMEMNRAACELVRSGRLGRVIEVRAVNFPGPSLAPYEGAPAQDVPKGLDWNMWLNQAAWRDFNGQWVDWMQWRDFSGGEMTNWGAHALDQIQWALGMDQSGPTEIVPRSPGRNGEVSMRYVNGVEVNFVLQWGHGPSGGAIFICEKGKIEINRNKFTSNPRQIAIELRKTINVAEEERKWSDSLALWQARWHMQNWLDCIRSRKKPVADVEIGHRSVTVCHLANIVRAVGRPLRWDPVREDFESDSEASGYLERSRRQGFELPAISA